MSRTRVLLWLGTTVFIVYAATIPFNMTSDRAVVSGNLSRVTLHPFFAPDTGRRVSIPDAVQNTILFAPFGAFGFLALRKRLRSSAGRVLMVTALASLLSAAVETLQLFTVDRTTSVSDLVANTLGACGGAVAVGVVAAGFPRAFQRLRTFGVVDVPAFYPMMIGLIVTIVAAWEPFDFTLDVGSLMGKVRALQADPWQFTGVTDEGVAVVRYLLLALAISLWLRQLQVPRAATRGAMAAIAVALGLEAGQWIVESRMPGLEDAGVHSMAAGLGAALSRGWPHGRSLSFWTGALAVATYVGGALQMWAGFSAASTYRSFILFPFLSYYENAPAVMVSHVIELALIYLPLGFVLATVIGDPRRLWRVALALVLVIAGSIEGVQGFMAGRYPDVTDVGVSALGLLCGAWLGGPGRLSFTKVFLGAERE